MLRELSDAQVNKLTQAMYLVHEMLKTRNEFYNAINVGAAMADPSSDNYSRRAKDSEKLKKTMNAQIKSLPSQREYKDAISILQLHANRPGVIKLLEDVYEEYPELKPKLSAIAGQKLT